jgi:hypothetical protein
MTLTLRSMQTRSRGSRRNQSWRRWQDKSSRSSESSSARSSCTCSLRAATLEVAAADADAAAKEPPVVMVVRDMLQHLAGMKSVMAPSVGQVTMRIGVGKADLAANAGQDLGGPVRVVASGRVE